MGQKVSPVGLRVGVNRDWDSRWYANDQDFAGLLHEDIRVREYILKKLKTASVAKVEIERSKNRVTIFVHTSRPGVVIGKDGESVDALRKEVKDHGDKGILLGSPIADGDKVVIIEDVTTAGTSIEETLPIIKAQGDVDVLGLVVSVDRCERGKGEKSALTEIQEKYGFRTTAIVTMKEVVEHLYNKEYKGKVIIDDTLKAAIDAYYEQYGVK